MTKLRQRQLPPSSLQSNYFPFEGGLNIVDPALSLNPGELVASKNFEIDIRGRYRRMDGYKGLMAKRCHRQLYIIGFHLQLVLLEIQYLITHLVLHLICRFHLRVIW